MKGSRTGSSGSKGTPERLQKVLAQAGFASRRGIEAMIREERITVNGKLAEIGQRVDLAVDAVKIDGKRVFEGVAERRYLLLNKPAGCVSTREDPEGRATVLDLLPPRMRRGLVPVGRLDYETEGLLILTDDGDLAQHIAHPRYGCLKTYEVKVKGRPERAAIKRLRDGIVLFGKRTAPLSLASRSAPSGPRASVSNSWWTVSLGEGRTRQIREMFFRIGHPVSRLRRVAIGPVADPHLPSGGWRELSEKEVELLRRRTARPVKKPVAKKPVKRKAASGVSEAEGADLKKSVTKKRSTKASATKAPTSGGPKRGRGSRPAGTAKGRGGRGRGRGPKRG